MSHLQTSAPSVAPAFTAAPMPNTDLNAPIPTEANGNAPSLAPSLFSPRATYRGEGFVSGSTAQGAQFSKVKPGFGGTLSIPVQ
ncbi:MAG: hypothetical protein JOY70_03580 [Acidisphaera sp.]|nr:hypothetical protein [Acidisphaera sp.]